MRGGGITSRKGKIFLILLETILHSSRTKRNRPVDKLFWQYSHCKRPHMPLFRNLKEEGADMEQTENAQEGM